MLRLFFSALLALSISACTIKPTTDYRIEHNFSQYTSFAFSPIAEDMHDSIDDARIKNALLVQLAQKSLIKTDLKEASLQVIYRMESEAELEPFGLSTGFGYSRRGSSLIITKPNHYSEREYGKLVVEFLDPKTNTIVWKSISQKRLPETLRTKKRAEFINKEIAVMINAYPPATK